MSAPGPRAILAASRSRGREAVREPRWLTMRPGPGSSRPSCGRLGIEIAALERREATLVVENAVLAAERSEALEQQTATADILRVIGRSPTDLQPVLETSRRAPRGCAGAERG